MGQAIDEGWRDEQIRLRAHAIWEREGRPDGKEREHWLRAEQEVAEWVGSPISNHALKSKQGVIPPSPTEDVDGTSIQSGGSLSDHL